MNKPVLVVMAAGMGSRYGGMKQIDPVGPNGQVIMDYSLYDARRAGFETVIFVIKHEIEDVIGLPALDAPEISAKNGINIRAVLEDVVKNVPAPQGDRDAPLQALIFDSQYDSYRGVIVYLRVKNGVLRPGMDVRMMATGAEYKIVEVGTLRPTGMDPVDALGAGEVGYLTASIKNVADTRVGDTVTGVENPCTEALPGYKTVQPMVYSGVYPADGSKYGDLRDALEKLKLNDASMSYTQENSIALGFGFRCGFLGLLHMEIIMERLEREYNLDLITTAPNVVYRITKTNGETVEVYTPLNYPDPSDIAASYEPFVRASILTPPEYVGSIMDLCQQRRGDDDHNGLDKPRRNGDRNGNGACAERRARNGADDKGHCARTDGRNAHCIAKAEQIGHGSAGNERDHKPRRQREQTDGRVLFEQGNIYACDQRDDGKLLKHRAAEKRKPGKGRKIGQPLLAAGNPSAEKREQKTDEHCDRGPLKLLVQGAFCQPVGKQCEQRHKDKAGQQSVLIEQSGERRQEISHGAAPNPPRRLKPFCGRKTREPAGIRASRAARPQRLRQGRRPARG